MDAMDTVPARYYHLSLGIPARFRMRRPLEDRVCSAFSEGKHLIIRGFPKIGKSKLMRTVIAKRSEGKERVIFSVKDMNMGGVEEHMKVKLKCMKKALGMETEVEPDSLMRIIGSINKEFVLGIDDLEHLRALGREGIAELVGKIKNPPKNVHIILCGRRDSVVDEVLEKELLPEGNFEGFTVSQMAESESEYLIREPARTCNRGYYPDTVRRIIELSGTRPWDIFIVCYYVTIIMEEDNNLLPDTIIGKADVEKAVTIANLECNELGEKMLDNYRKFIEFGMSEDERRLARMIIFGEPIDREKHAALIDALHESGFLRNMEINGEILRQVTEAYLADHQ